MKKKVQVIDWGLVDYAEAYRRQKEAVQQVIEGSEDRLYLCEHPSVFTMGRLASEEHFLLNQDEILRRGIDILRIDRGGEVTLHSPGQLVVYPIINLAHWQKDVHKYLHELEAVVIDLLKDFDIVATRVNARTGVWIEKRKILSIGVGVKKWVAFHGMALNVKTQLELFQMIRPCGLNVHMTSLEQELRRPINMELVKENLVNCFCAHFGYLRREK